MTRRVDRGHANRRVRDSRRRRGKTHAARRQSPWLIRLPNRIPASELEMSVEIVGDRRRSPPAHAESAMPAFGLAFGLAFFLAFLEGSASTSGSMSSVSQLLYF